MSNGPNATPRSRRGHCQADAVDQRPVPWCRRRQTPTQGQLPLTPSLVFNQGAEQRLLWIITIRNVIRLGRSISTLGRSVTATKKHMELW